jgi:predicted enzyme related to lactoylglutathione lyase
MGNDFVHSELATGDLEGAKKFYKSLFTWKLKQLGPDMGNYVLIDTGSKSSGGGMAPKMMPEQPTAWTPYVQVDSVKRTIAKAESLGAKIVMAYQPIGDMGAIGIFVDPTGAALGVWEKSAPPPPAKKAAKKPAAKKAPAKKAKKKKR